MTDASPTSRSSCRNTSWPLPCCSWRELDRIGQAKLLRAVDELGTARGESRSTDFQVWAPEGFTVGVSRNKPTAAQARAGKDGNPTKIGWKNYRSIANALLAITDAGIQLQGRKMRCFFKLAESARELRRTP
jgi:hypothetical protein